MNNPNKYPYIQYMYSYPHKTAYGPLEDIWLDDYIHILKEPGRANSLYFHIPFCQTKCGYCNLFSLPGQSQEWMEAYLDAMEEQAIQYGMEDVSFEDFIIGGGTPLILPESSLHRIFQMSRKYFGLKEKAGIVIETSPNQTTKEKLNILKQNRVTRISIGVQSFHDEELETLNRKHSVRQVRKALESIRLVSFPCMNLDLIYGVPGQTPVSLEYSVCQALEYEPDEIFAYPLYVKRGTYLSKTKQQALDNTYEMYELVRDMLISNGYRQDSMRRFVKVPAGLSPKENHRAGNKTEKNHYERSYESCGFQNTISIGCGGRSYIDKLHFCTPYGVEYSYCKKLLEQYIHTENYRKITHGYILNEEEQKRRYVIKHILVRPGIELKEYENLYGRKLLEDFSQLVQWEEQGLALERGGYFSLTEQGLSMSDYLGPMLISQEIKEKMHRFYEIGGENGCQNKALL